MTKTINDIADVKSTQLLTIIVVLQMFQPFKLTFTYDLVQQN